MSDLSLLWKDLLFDRILGISPADARYLALLTLAADESDTGTSIQEVTYGGYARVLLGAGNWSATSGGVRMYAAAVNFAFCVSDPQYAVGFALVTAASDGDLVGFDEFDSPALIEVGVIPKFPANAFGVPLPASSG